MFWKRKGPPPEELAAVRADILALQSALRTLNDEMVALHDRCHRWMRRAVSAEGAMKRTSGRAVEEAGQDPRRAVADTLRGLHGARRRIAERKLRLRRPELFETVGANGDGDADENEGGD